MIISLRRFRVSKAKRSKSYKQLVVPIYVGSIRQITVRQKTKKRRQRKTGQGFTEFLQLRVSLPVVLLVIGLSGVTYFSWQVYQGHKVEPLKTFTSLGPIKTVADEALPRSVPTNITIPSVGIDYPVMAVGRDSTGAIQMPPLFAWTTGWYQYSPTPGQIGPSIIVGHVDNYKTISVFWRLRYVQRGDMINVARADGSTVHFKVVALRQFNQSNFPTQEVYGNLQYPGLRLITCGGAFDQQTASYTQNTVVYAFMVSSTKG